MCLFRRGIDAAAAVGDRLLGVVSGDGGHPRLTPLTSGVTRATARSCESAVDSVLGPPGGQEFASDPSSGASRAFGWRAGVQPHRTRTADFPVQRSMTHRRSQTYGRDSARRFVGRREIGQLPAATGSYSTATSAGIFFASRIRVVARPSHGTGGYALLRRFPSPQTLGHVCILR